jgi:DeoR/GlpR family transcriptional regulator of sugar metabolism
MLSGQRRSEILVQISKKIETSVTELVEKFDVSIATIRRDLDKLENEGFIKRTHGGAVLETRSLVDFSYIEREKKFTQSKILIANEVVNFIEAGDRIFLNDGTTIIQVAKQIVKKDIPITVMTNSIKVADILLNNSKIEVIIIGGHIRDFSFASSGPFAEIMIESLQATKAIIGADAFHPVKGVSIQPIGEATLTKKMISNSQKVIVVGDSSKIGTIAAVIVCKWKDVDIFITDSIDAISRKAIEKESADAPIISCPNTIP